MRVFIVSKKYLIFGALALLFLGAVGKYTIEAIPSLVKEPGTYYMVQTQEKVLALTFDDGPDPLYTGSILDILREKQVKATFFVLGENAKKNPELLLRIHKEGHEIGNHGYTHSYVSSRFTGELIRTDELLYHLTGQYTRYYRPPGGIVSKAVINEVKEIGRVLTLWSIDSRDWLNPGPNRIIQNVTKSAFPGGIVLLHDGGEKREQTAQALTGIIEMLRGQGYRFVTVSELKNFEGGTPVHNQHLK